LDKVERVLLGKLETGVSDIKDTLSEFKLDNKEDHNKIFEELSKVSTRVTVVEGVAGHNSKKIKSHEDCHWKSLGLLCGISGVIVGALTWAITTFVLS